ncbi:MAG: diacylglycerol kinase family lipid kinase [Eubacteriaceae bacterium]|nr:diacylglycerol kinase family lipid kinase [Eubacteriaceae bacterium]
MKKVLIVLNPCAGTRQANRYLAEIIDIFCKADYQVSVATTGKSGDGTVIARERAHEFDLIVGIGGDGTFNEVVAGVLEAEADVPLGYIPAGSTNDFANSMGLSTKILQAAEDIVSGEPKTLDIGTFNGRFFSYVASFGAFTRASYEAPQSIKNALGHLAYILEGIKDIPSLAPLEVRVNMENGVYGGKYLFGAVCNSTSVGGLLTLSEEQVDMNDGKFEVLLIKSPGNIIELNQIIFALSTGNYNNCKLISFFSSGDLEIEAPEDMPWSLDGEYQEGNEKIHIKNIKSAIKLITKNNR